jgi:hypothetical protein
MDWRHMDDVSAVGKGVYGDLLNLCFWNKSNAGMGSLYRSKHELIFVYRVGAAPHLNMVELGKHGRNRTNVWDYASVNSFVGSRREDLALHPTVKPTALVADSLQDVTKRGDLVLDIFLGSGTTLIAPSAPGDAFEGSISTPPISTLQSSAGRRSPAKRRGRHPRTGYDEEPYSGRQLGVNALQEGAERQSEGTSAQTQAASVVALRYSRRTPYRS